MDDAREYLEKVYAKQGMKSRAITAQLDDLEESEELLTTAQAELQKEKTETQKLIQSAKEQTKEEKRVIAEFNNSVTQTIQSFPKQRQSAIIETATKAIDIINEIGKDPKAYVQFMDLLSYYKNGSFDLSVFEKQGTSKAVSGLRDKISASRITSASKANNPDSILEKAEYELVV